MPLLEKPSHKKTIVFCKFCFSLDISNEYLLQILVFLKYEIFKVTLACVWGERILTIILHLNILLYINVNISQNQLPIQPYQSFHILVRVSLNVLLMIMAFCPSIYLSIYDKAWGVLTFLQKRY